MHPCIHAGRNLEYLTMYSSAGCNMPCTGSSAQTCGGASSHELYMLATDGQLLCYTSPDGAKPPFWYSPNKFLCAPDCLDAPLPHAVSGAIKVVLTRTLGIFYDQKLQKDYGFINLRCHRCEEEGFNTWVVAGEEPLCVDCSGVELPYLPPGLTVLERSRAVVVLAWDPEDSCIPGESFKTLASSRVLLAML